jgi:hypothetical protein
VFFDIYSNNNSLFIFDECLYFSIYFFYHTNSMCLCVFLINKLIFQSASLKFLQLQLLLIVEFFPRNLFRVITECTELQPCFDNACTVGALMPGNKSKILGKLSFGAFNKMYLFFCARFTASNRNKRLFKISFFSVESCFMFYHNCF